MKLCDACGGSGLLLLGVAPFRCMPCIACQATGIQSLFPVYPAEIRMQSGPARR